jgi:hypothetical protein
MRSIRICVIRLLSALKSLSWSLRRFLKTLDVSVTQALRSFVVWYSSQTLSHLRLNNFFSDLLMSLFSSRMTSSFFAHSLSNHFRLRFFDVSSAARRLRSRAIVSLRLILLQCVFVRTLCSLSCNLIRVFVCSSVRCNSMSDIYVSTSRSWWEIVLNASQTVRRFCFCKSMRFLMNFMNEFERPCDACHVLNSYVMTDLTTAVYTCLVFLKQAPHVDAVRRVSASICVVIFSWILLTCLVFFSKCKIDLKNYVIQFVFLFDFYLALK